MQNLRRNLTLGALMAVLMAAMLPQLACAATAKATGTSATGASAPLASGPIDAQIWPGQQNQTTAVIVDVTLDPSVKLPARVRIPVPRGATVQWTGEILSGSASDDQERPSTLATVAAGVYAEFTMSVSHRGQLEADGIPMTVTGAQASAQVDWTQSVPSTSTQFSVRLPAGVSAVKIDPAPVAGPETNSAGESLYTLAPLALATGAVSTVKVSYNLNPAATPAAASGNVTVVYAVLGGLLVVLVAVVVFMISRQGGVAPAQDQGSQDSESDDEYELADDLDDSAHEEGAKSDDARAGEAGSGTADAAGRDARPAGRAGKADTDDDPFDVDFDE